MLYSWIVSLRCSLLNNSEGGAATWRAWHACMASTAMADREVTATAAPGASHMAARGAPMAPCAHPAAATATVAALLALSPACAVAMEVCYALPARGTPPHIRLPAPVEKNEIKIIFIHDGRKLPHQHPPAC